MAMTGPAPFACHNIAVDRLTKSFGAKPVLHQISFNVRPGEILAIVGNSGCGKSVLLRHLVGLEMPDHGEVRIADESLGELDDRELLEVQKNFGVLFQGGALIDYLTVKENVSFRLQREGLLAPGEIKQLAVEALAMVGLEEAGDHDKKPAELSGGMRKRVGLARAIVASPKILLYDEPTSELDPVYSNVIDDLILRVWEKKKATSIVITHDVRTLKRIRHRVLMLKGVQPEDCRDPAASNLIFDGTVAEFLASSQPEILEYLRRYKEENE
jgi:phospholipid/cholesterol/gamma-HCH transport system ATP-binding protein